MNRRVDIDMEVQWPPAKASGKWSMQQKVVNQLSGKESLSNQSFSTAEDTARNDLKTYISGELFAGAREVAIKHAGSVYRLKITRQGKLILNK